MTKKFSSTRINLLLITIFFPIVAMSNDETDTLVSEIDSILPDVRIASWHINQFDFSREYVYMDTTVREFHHSTPIQKQFSSPAYLGNVGQAAFSNAYFENNQQSHDNIFIKPFEVYHYDIDNPTYYNVTRPFSDITFTQAQSNFNHINVFHTQNVRKDFNFGGRLNYWESEGAYVYQKTNFKDLQAFYSYDGSRYKSSASYNFSTLRAQELEGIMNDSLLDSKYNYSEDEIPVHSSGFNQGRYETEDATSKIVRHNLKVSQEWNLARARIETNPLTIERLPFKRSIGHNFEFDKSERLFSDLQIDTSLIKTFYSDSTKTKDFAKTYFLKNEFFAKISKDFSPQTFFNLQANFGVKYIDYQYNDVLWEQANTQRFNEYLSASLFSKISSKTASGIFVKYTFHGREAGNYIGNVYYKQHFAQTRDTLHLLINAEYKCETPSYYYNHYASNNYVWNNNFNDVKRLFVTAKFGSQKDLFGIEANLQTIEGYLYFAENSLPQQANENIAVYSIELQKLTRLWKFYMDNKFTFQSSSNADILPLPTLASVNSLYFRHANSGKLFDFMIGVELWYTTKYFAPAYNYLTGMFEHQTEKEIGNYPYLDAFMNLKVKRLRFFAKYNHFNSLFMDGEHFGTLHYPTPRANYAFGFSWQFYN